jgi:carboxyl-terminal processing protease
VGKAAWSDHWAFRRLLYLWVLVGAIALTGCDAAQAPQPAVSAPLPTTAAMPVVPAPQPSPTTAPPSPRPSPATTTRPSSTSVATTAPLLEPTEPPTPTPLAISERQQIFEEVWRTVKQNYLYANFRGLDWDGMRDEYQSRIAVDQSQDAFYGDMAEMVARLDDHHSRFLPPAAAQAQDATTRGYENTVGIGVLTQPKQDGAFIQLVFPDSPAARADLRPRDRIIAVDGRPYVASDGDLHGPARTTVRLNVVRPGEKPRDVVLVRQEIQGRIAPSYRRFPGDIGYVGIPTLWVNDMDEQVSGALTELVADGRLHGLILDVRANGGGWSKVLSGILSHFVRGQVGMFFDQRHIRPLVIEPPAGPDLRGLPLVVLVDGDTASYAEVLAAILQRENGALVVGTPTAGNTETIYAYTLRDGSRLWLAQEGFRLQNGTNLEGAGVQPNSIVDVDWTRYSEDDDPQLLEALRLLGAGPK